MTTHACIEERRSADKHDIQLMERLVQELLEQRIQRCPHHEDLASSMNRTEESLRAIKALIEKHDHALYNHGTGLVYQAVERSIEAKRRDRILWFLLGGVLPLLAFLSPWVKWIVLDR